MKQMHEIEKSPFSEVSLIYVYMVCFTTSIPAVKQEKWLWYKVAAHLHQNMQQTKPGKINSTHEKLLCADQIQ